MNVAQAARLGAMTAALILVGCERSEPAGHAGHADAAHDVAGAVGVQVTSEELASESGPQLAIRWKFTARDGRPAALERVHEKPIHAILVSKDLSWFLHEHPEPVAPGLYELGVANAARGGVVLFSQFKGAGSAEQMVRTPVETSGAAAAAKPLVGDASETKRIGAYSVSLAMTNEPAGGAVMRYTILEDGKPVMDLQPYLGAFGHAVAISADTREFVHVHPAETGVQTGVVEFHAEFPAGGVYASWMQFQHRDVVVTVPFVVQADVAGGSSNGHEGHGHH